MLLPVRSQSSLKCQCITILLYRLKLINTYDDLLTLLLSNLLRKIQDLAKVHLLIPDIYSERELIRTQWI